MAGKRCLIIGSSPETDVNEIKRILLESDYIVCADGGYLFAMMIGVKPDLVVGDFDSCEKPASFDGEIISLPVKKDDTDILFAVRECMDRGYNDFVLCAVSGGREDHTFANYCVLRYIEEHGAKGRIIGNSTEVRVQKEGNVVIEGKNECGFGIFPFGCMECTVSLDGFEYGLDRGVLRSEYPVGVSNRIKSDKAEITVHSGCSIYFIYSN